MRWALIFATVFAVAFVLIVNAQKARSKTVNVCVDIKLPKPGKCKYMTVQGYKVRVCL